LIGRHAPPHAARLTGRRQRATVTQQGGRRMAEFRWERLTAPELRDLAARDALVVLPVASLEQHGPHLPVWTDSFIGHAVCVRAAELAADLPAVVLPPLWTGLSEHHFPFGGTVSLDYPTFHAVLRCVVRSILAGGFRRLFLVNSHGGNIDALAVSARELAHEFAIPVAAATHARLAAAAIAEILETQSSMHHACEAETAVWLALDPAQVRTEKLAETASNGGFAANEAALSRFWSFAERAPRTGVRGDPRAATAEKGERLLAAMAEAVAKAMRDPALSSPPDAVWTPGRAQRGQG
jgi:creatinine amidohydrolase